MMDTKEDTTGQEENLSLRKMILEFSQETSLHGIKFALDECVSKYRRLLWTGVVLCQVVTFAYLMVRSLGHIQEKPFVTRIITNYVHKLAFPAVSLCKSIDTNHPMLSQFERDFIQNYVHVNRTFFESMSSEEYERINVSQTLKRVHMLEAGLIRRCRFNNQKCMKLVRRLLWSNKLCYTINGHFGDLETSENVTEEDVTDFETVYPCPEEGMFLDIGFTNRTERNDIKIMIHQPEERMSKTTFLQLAPDTLNFISLKVKKNKFLPPPYMAFGDTGCVETGSGYKHPLFEDGKYSLETCLARCRETRFVDMCGCHLDVSADEDEMCKPLELINCVEMLGRQNQTKEDERKECNCPFPCEDVIYETTLSSTPLGFRGGEGGALISAKIFFARLRTEITEQVEDYTDADVFATVGGHMGLFLGASLITVGELVELLLRVAWRWIVKKSRRSGSTTVHVLKPGKL